LAIALALVAFVIAIVFASRGGPEPARRIKLTAGPSGTTRALVARELASEISARGIACEVVEMETTTNGLDAVNAGTVDLALVSGAFRIERDSNVREVAALNVEALHLLVKPQIADTVGDSLAGLRGRRIDLGPVGSAVAGLATAVLAFSDLAPSTATPNDGFVALHLKSGELEALVERGDPDALPDAVFILATLPSKVALGLVRTAGYRLAPLPFAEAFRLNALISKDPETGSDADIERVYTMQTAIPAFIYETQPAVPSAALPTLGAQLLLVANARVSPETVGEVLGAIFDSPFARIFHPPLDRALLGGTPRLTLHDGTTAFLARNDPVITQDTVDGLSSTLSILGAIVGGGAFLVQGWRQRRRAARDALLSGFLLRVAAIESRVVEIELSADMELDTLMTLQRELLQLKSEVLLRFTAGELGEQSALSDTLAPINAARDHVGELLLHVRNNLESKAESEGRTVDAVWVEAAEGGDEKPSKS
jgi:TRAP-type uncharacterized transport system substrate-binding protein